MIKGITSSFASITLIRILSRILQFLLRVYLIRTILSPQTLSSLLTLDLLTTTALHIAKNCLKPSYQQVEGGGRGDVIASMNLMTLGVGATVVSAGVLMAINWSLGGEHLQTAIILYALASVMEALREKYSVQMVLHYQYKKIAIIQLVSYLPKTALFFVAARVGLFEKYSLLCFGVGNLLFYTIGFLITLYMSSIRPVLFLRLPQEELSANSSDEKGSNLNEKRTVNDKEENHNDKKEEKPNNKKQQNPKNNTSSPTYLHPKSKQFLHQLSLLSLLKLLLQQFQKLALVLHNTVDASSVYSLVSNLGAIVVRFVFAPLEEVEYNYFARGGEKESLGALIGVVRALGVFALFCLGFGCRYAQNVLTILYGQKWITQDSILALQSYMLLLSILGLNGTIQAFVMARADVQTTLPKFKYFTIASTALYIGSSVLFLGMGMGASGLFLGNCIGMGLRMCISWYVEISRHVSLFNFLKQVTLGLPFYLTLVLCLVASTYIRLQSPLLDLCAGVGLALVALLPVLWEFRVMVRELLVKGKAIIKGKGNKKQ